MQRLPLRVLLTLCLCGAIVARAARVSAAEQALRVERVSVGFAGKYKVGHWTPITIDFVSDQPRTGQVAVVVTDADGAPVTFSVGQTATTFAPGQSTRVVGYAKFGRLRSGLRVQVRAADGLLLDQPFSTDELPAALNSTSRLMVNLGPQVNMAEAIRRLGDEQERPSVADLKQSAELPDSWIGYEGVDSLILIAGDGSALTNIRREQVDAIRTWVEMGGRLLLSCGRQGNELLAEGRPLNPLLPGKFLRTQPLPSTANLERYVEATQRIPPSNDLTISVLTDLPSKAELTEPLGVSRDTALISRVPLGFGQFVWVAFDLDAAALLGWPSRTPLMTRILGSDRSERPTVTRRDELGQVTRLGYHDIAGQLRSALDQFSGVTVVQFSWIAAGILLYLAVIGPGDYFLLSKLSIPHYWTWATFPVVALAFVGGAYWLNSDTKGSRTRVNQLDIVDYDVVSGGLRGTTWTHIYSPVNQRVSVRFQPQSQTSEGQPVRVVGAWHGLPGDGLGGLDAGGESAPFVTGYSIEGKGTFKSNVQLVDLPLYTASTRSLSARWWGDLPRERNDALSVDDSGLLQGHVDNPFEFTLNECLLIYDNWVYRIERPMQPGGTFDVDRVRPLNLHWRLTQRHVVKSTDVSTPWNPSHTDMPRIIELLMFYDAAGGESYARLTNRYQPYIDFSSRIRRDWAVLIGTTERPACDVLLNEVAVEKEDYQRWVVYRALVPVRKANPSRSE